MLKIAGQQCVMNEKRLINMCPETPLFRDINTSFYDNSLLQKLCETISFYDVRVESTKVFQKFPNIFNVAHGIII